MACPAPCSRSRPHAPHVRSQACAASLALPPPLSRHPSLNLSDNDSDAPDDDDDDAHSDSTLVAFASAAASSSAASDASNPRPWWPFHRRRRPTLAAGYYSRLPKTADSLTRSSTPSSASSLDDLEKQPLYRSPSAFHRRGLSGLWRRRRFRRRLRLRFRQRWLVAAATTLALIAVLVWAVLYQVVRPPPYNLVPPRDYSRVLSSFALEHNLVPTQHSQPHRWSSAIADHLSVLRERTQERYHLTRCSTTRRSKLVSVPTDPAAPPAAIPSTLFSSDRVPPPPKELAKWKEDWSALEFDPHFLEEDAADAFVDEHFGLPAPAAALGDSPDSSRILGRTKSTPAPPEALSATQHAWRALPRGVLRADFLRYILLLVQGGSWADMDVTPLGKRSTWTVPQSRWLPAPARPMLPTASASAPAASAALHQGLCPGLNNTAPVQEPIRLVVGLECEPWEYMSHSARAWLEALHILPMNRHREVQFTQWALHGAAGHPVLVDVLRRLLLADKRYDAYTVSTVANSSLEMTTDGAPMAKVRTHHPWTDIVSARKWVAPAPRYPPLGEGKWDDEISPWVRWPIWPWMWSWPRWGWHELSVEEWTGPAVWTDAVFSYLYAVAGVRPRDLYGLSQPVQVADVLIAPGSWFNPPHPKSFTGQAKVIHNFRGSWKHGADTVPAVPVQRR